MMRMGVLRRRRLGEEFYPLCGANLRLYNAIMRSQQSLYDQIVKFPSRKSGAQIPLPIPCRRRDSAAGTDSVKHGHHLDI